MLTDDKDDLELFETRQVSAPAIGDLMTAGDAPSSSTITANTRSSALKMNTCELTRLVDQPWRGAEAIHFLMLAQNQLHSGLHEQALRTALLLRDYDDIVEPKKVYAVIGELSQIRSLPLSWCKYRNFAYQVFVLQLVETDLRFERPCVTKKNPFKKV